MTDIKTDVLNVIRETRPMLMEHYGRIADLKKKTEMSFDVVTKLDHEVEEFLSKRLKEIDPESGFFGEEFGGDTDKPIFWLCDPIDGTGHFVRGMPFCTTMLARIENGIVTFSAIYKFVDDIMYHAERGRGAYENGQKIGVSTRSLKNAYLAYETHEDNPANLQKFLVLNGKSCLFNTVNSGFEFAMVASGKIDGRVCFDPWGKEWDYAPGSLLVEEAGGVVANIGKRTYDYQNRDFIAANKEVFRELTSGDAALFPIQE